jgi:hypothetical protein
VFEFKFFFSNVLALLSNQSSNQLEPWLPCDSGAWYNFLFLSPSATTSCSVLGAFAESGRWARRLDGLRMYRGINRSSVTIAGGSDAGTMAGLETGGSGGGAGGGTILISWRITKGAGLETDSIGGAGGTVGGTVLPSLRITDGV